MKDNEKAIDTLETAFSLHGEFIDVEGLYVNTYTVKSVCRLSIPFIMISLVLGVFNRYEFIVGALHNRKEIPSSNRCKTSSNISIQWIL